MARTFAPEPGRTLLCQFAPPSFETKTPCSEVAYIVGCAPEPKPTEMSLTATGSGRLRTPAGFTTVIACEPARNAVRASVAEFGSTQSRRGTSGKPTCFCQVFP